MIGGFWDGSLILLDYDNKIQFILNTSYDELNKENQWMKPMIDSNLDISPIVYICISKDNLSAYCGTLNGTLYSFEIEELTKWSWKNEKRVHFSAITHINLNSTLNMLGTIGEDNYVFLYTTPLLQTTTSIHIDKSDQYILDYIFLSASPVPCFALYCISKGEFRVYDINGTFIQKVNESEYIGRMISPIIVTDVYYKDYLIYVNKENEVVIRKFPFMERNNNNKISEKIQNINDIRFITLNKEGMHLYMIGDSSNITILKV